MPKNEKPKKRKKFRRRYSSDETTESECSSDYDTKRKKDKTETFVASVCNVPYKQFKDLAMLLYAITGGVESPMQFIFQVCIAKHINCFILQ